MSWFLCTLWPYLAGGLIAWLICGRLAHKLKYQPLPRERIVEKVVEKIVEVEVEPPAARAAMPMAMAASQVPTIDLAAATAAGFSLDGIDDLTAIEGIGPAINTLLHEAGIDSFAVLADTDADRIQQVLDEGGGNFKFAVPTTWPDQAHLALHNRWAALKVLQDVLVHGVYPTGAPADSEADSSAHELSESRARVHTLEAELAALRAGPALDGERAALAGFTLRLFDDADDLTVVEGIGPKICELLHAAGIRRFAQLAQTDPAHIQQLLGDAGPRFMLARPGTWPAQGALAANNHWEALKAWQDVLDGGEEVQ